MEKRLLPEAENALPASRIGLAAKLLASLWNSPVQAKEFHKLYYTTCSIWKQVGGGGKFQRNLIKILESLHLFLQRP